VGWYHKKHFPTHTHPDHQTAFLPPNQQRQSTEGTRHCQEIGDAKKTLCSVAAQQGAAGIISATNTEIDPPEGST